MTEMYLGYPPSNIREWIKKNYKKEDPLMKPLTFTALENGSVSLHLHGANFESAEALGTEFGMAFQNKLRYSINNSEWHIIGDFWDTDNYRDNDLYLNYGLNKGDIIQFKCKDGISIERFFINDDVNISFNATAVKVSGNIMTLLDPTGMQNTVIDQCFNGLFAETSIVDASELLLPATTVGNNAYQAMFYGCESLTKAPELPAAIIGEYAYKSMFDGCISLETPPSILPAETLAHSCYFQMFQDCAKLKTIPNIKATTLGASCCGLMFNGCSSLRDLSEFELLAKDPPEENSGLYCYQGMFYNSGVTHSPIIAISNIIYDGTPGGVGSGTVHLMFAQCKNLKQASFIHINKTDYNIFIESNTFAEAASNIELHLRDGIEYINN